MGVLSPNTNDNTSIFKSLFYQEIYEKYIKSYFVKEPIIKKNTFIVWEPCSKSHSEVVPGFTKYLLDLGYRVSVLVNPDRIREGLFSRFDNENILINKLNKKQIQKYFKRSDLSEVKGVLITTAGKLCDSIHYDECYETFNKNVDKNKIFLVEHEIKHSVDNNTWKENIITLREMNYKNAKSVVVNPHYFGDIKINPKNSDITKFVTIGALNDKRKDSSMIINAVSELHNKGITNFKVTVIGKGHLKNLPNELHKYFDIKGRLPFNKMYEEIENSDFILNAYDKNNPQHLRYNTTGTSGNFQLVYGFLKPCIILDDFAKINGFDNENAILYKSSQSYAEAMEKAIIMSVEDYKSIQNNLKNYADKLYTTSLKNFEGLING